jgi:hypothetical protein
MSDMSVRIVAPSSPILLPTPSKAEPIKTPDPHPQEQAPQPSEPAESNDAAKPPFFIIRKARVNDISAMADLLTQAFWHEDAAGRFMHPYRDEHPKDFFRYWRRRVARAMCDWHRELFVASLTDAEGTVVGVADWSDYSGQDAKKGTKWLLRTFPPSYHSTSR